MSPVVIKLINVISESSNANLLKKIEELKFKATQRLLKIFIYVKSTVYEARASFR